mmetsp:Transcript_7775/g.13374  ORF Transcript_7775/g.13374 Transcript_7775/m.13374 type:complete len:219 (+) Transcript_7775:3603-4259(+)
MADGAHLVLVFGVLVVDDLQGLRRLLHHAIGRAAVRAYLSALALVVELLEERSSLKHLRAWAAELAQVPQSLLPRNHDPRARLADVLQDGDCVLEVPDVEHRKLQLDVPKVARALHQQTSAGDALALLVRSAQPPVQHAVGERLALRHLVEVALEHLELGVAHYLLRGHEPEPDRLDLLGRRILLERLVRVEHRRIHHRGSLQHRHLDTDPKPEAMRI